MTHVMPDLGSAPSVSAAAPTRPLDAPATARTSWPASPAPQLRPWTRRYAQGVAVVDVGLTLVGVCLAFVLRFYSLDGTAADPGAYLAVSAALVVGWVAVLTALGAYDAQRATSGPDDFKRVLLAGAVIAGIVAVVCYVGHVDIARGFVGGAVPIGTVLLLGGRVFTRQMLRRHRADGRWGYRIVVGGTSESVRHFVEVTRRRPDSGMTVIGACVEDASVGSDLAPGVPVLAGVTDIAGAAAGVDADVVALAGSGLGPETIRELGWALEGTGRDLVMVPGLTEVAGPRVSVRPVDGLPMVWVDKPVLRGYKRILKRGVDATVAAVMLLLLAPLFAVIGLLIKLDTPGPVFFTQTRFGKAGGPFRIWKFRSMSADASSQHLTVMTEAGTEEGRLFFKVKCDPRITRVGRILRKLSLDELPQLLNVLNGTMSLVGPRPQVEHEVAAYDGATRRRLLVKPGMTGLWQVSGRSDLAPEDGVRLDLYYVENWSLALDFAIIGRTVWSVLRGSGAY